MSRDPLVEIIASIVPLPNQTYEEIAQAIRGNFYLKEKQLNPKLCAKSGWHCYCMNNFTECCTCGQENPNRNLKED